MVSIIGGGHSVKCSVCFVGSFCTEIKSVVIRIVRIVTPMSCVGCHALPLFGSPCSDSRMSEIQTYARRGRKFALPRCCPHAFIDAVLAETQGNASESTRINNYVDVEAF